MWKWAMSVILPLILALFPSLCSAQALSSVQVGDTLTSLNSRLGGPPSKRQIMGPFTVQKWTMPDHNDLSITAFTKTQIITYLETDWGNSPSGAYSDFGSFHYGQTSLADIQATLGNNGFAFKQNAMQDTNAGVVMFNCYGIRDKSVLDICFVTLVSKADIPTVVRKQKPIAAAAHLVALILSTDDYLSTIWGNAKLYDSAYQPIAWQ